MSEITNREEWNKAREKEARVKGVERSKRRRESQAKRGDLSSTAAGMMTSEQARDDVAGLLAEYLEKSVSSKNKPLWFEHFDYHPVAKTAELALRCCLDAVGANWTRNNLVMQLADALNSSILSQVLGNSRDGQQVLKDIANRVASKPGAPRTRREHALYLAGKRKKKMLVDALGKPVTDDNGKNIFVVDESAYYWREWDTATKVKVGGQMLAAVFESTHLFENQYIKEDIKDEHPQVKIKLTEAAAKQLASLQDFLDQQTPQFGPMFNEPYPWGPDSSGPYDNLALAKLVPPVKHMGPDQEKAVWDAIRNGQMQEALDALNSLQEVPYTLNEYVVEAVRWITENNHGLLVDSFPTLEKTPELKNRKPAQWRRMTKDEQMDFRREQLAVSKGNREVDANMLGIKRNLDEADNILNAKADGVDGFYLPHQWDSRGRVYHTSEFGHHNTDYLRAMFLFKNQSPVTNENAKYLSLQLANTYGNGIDKETLEVRQAWAVKEEANILAAGKDFKDPDAFKFWRGADDPLQFLAACREWYNATEQGEGYMTGLPIALDATQSGIQVYAAMGRNEEDGQKVNLTANDVPGDLYTAVMNEANRLLDIDIQTLSQKDLEPSEDDDEVTATEKENDRTTLKHAKQWKKFGIDRKTAKRNTMCWAYSSRRYGFADQLRTDLMEPLAKKVRRKELKQHPFGEDRGFGASWYMAGINEQAITSVVKSAAAGMEFFQDVVQLCNQAGLHLTYTTPLGFPLHQFYRKLLEEKVVATEQRCSECEHTVKTHKKQVTLDDWSCPACGTVNTKEEIWEVVKERIDMPSWDRDAGKRKTIKATHRVYSSDVKEDKSKRAVAPNVIHSLDATVLMRTVSLCKANGVDDLMTVHDSFSTTIDNVGVMAWAIRQAFYETFDQYCPYEELLKQTMARLPDIVADKKAALQGVFETLTEADQDIITDAINKLEAMTGNKENRVKKAKAIIKHVHQSVWNKAAADVFIKPIAQRMTTIPDVPKKLKLDLSEVLKSQYAFS